MNKKNTTTNNFSLDSRETPPLFEPHNKSQQCMNSSVTKSDNSFFSDEYLPKGYITTHPFSLTVEELSGLLKNGQENHQNSQVIQPKPHKDYSGSTDYSDEKNQSKPAEDIECLNQSTLPGFIQEGQPNQTKSETPQTILNQESRISTDNYVEKFPHNSVEDSRKNNKSTSVGQLSDIPINCQKAQPPQTILNQESRVSTDYSVEKFSNKPVGGSGWLHKYTKLTETKTGLVEYPRVKEGQRSTNDRKHWYWNYCWHKKGKNGKPLYKKGKAVVSSVGCPQKKVRAVQNAILLTQRSANAARLPHRKILEIIKGDNSPRPPT